MTQYSKYTFDVTRTRTTVQGGVVTVIARTEREAAIMAETAKPKRWRNLSDYTKISREMREDDNG